MNRLGVSILMAVIGELADSLRVARIDLHDLAERVEEAAQHIRSQARDWAQSKPPIREAAE